MMRNLVLPEHTSWVRIAPLPDEAMSDEEFFAFCEANPDVPIERRSNGEIHILPPAGGETSFRKRADQETVEVVNVAFLDGDGRVAGFRLNLQRIREGL